MPIPKISTETQITFTEAEDAWSRIQTTMAVIQIYIDGVKREIAQLAEVYAKSRTRTDEVIK